MKEVTLYKNCKQYSGKDYSLLEMMDMIRNGEWKELITEYRKTLDKEGAKLNMPAFTGCGIFARHEKTGLKKYNDRIILDFDDVDVDSIKEEIGCDKYIEFMATSRGGTGIFMLVRVDGGVERHTENWLALKRYFQHNYGIKVDESTKDFSRLRFISYDPDLIYNPNSEVFSINTVDYRQIYINRISDIVNKSFSGCRNTFLLKASRLAGGCISAGILSESDIIPILQISAQSKGLSENEITAAIRNGIKYGKDFPIEIKYSQFDNNINRDVSNYTNMYKEIKSMCDNKQKWGEEELISFSDKYGVSKEEVKNAFEKIYGNEQVDESLPKIALVERYITKMYDIKRNIISQSVEAKKKNEKEFTVVNPADIWRELQHLKISFGLDNIKALLSSSFIGSYNPFIEYFEGLKWDGVERIDKLADYVTTDNQVYWKKMFKKALIRNIDCGLAKFQNRNIMALVGGQENGKSWFIRFLNPFGMKYYTESPLKSDKDTQFRFSECFIYNLEELQSLNSMEVNALKAIISQGVVRERKPYAINEVEQPRRCSFWASTNKSDFLTDDKNTRWLIFNVTSINWSYSKEIDIHQVWAEAYHLYKNGMDHQLTIDEQIEREFVNKGFEQCTNERDLIIRLFRVPEEKEKSEFMSNAEIMNDLKEFAPKLTMYAQNVGRSMSQLGYLPVSKKVNKHTQRGFNVVQMYNWSQNGNLRFITLNDTVEEIEEIKKKQSKVKKEEVMPEVNSGVGNLPF